MRLAIKIERKPMTLYYGPLVDSLMNTLFDIDDYKRGRTISRPSIAEVKYTDAQKAKLERDDKP